MKKGKNILNFLLAGTIVLLAFSGCQPASVLTIQAVPDFSISSFQTFDFYDIEVSGDTTGFPELIKWIEDEVASQLELKSLKHVEKEPDLLINIGVTIAELRQTAQTGLGKGTPMYAGSPKYGWESQTMELSTYEEGTAVVHFVDSDSKILLWEGIAQSAIVKKDKESKKNIAAGVKKLFSDL
ncbi:MAG: DUF4136 domain-containing protein [Bacteroides sp.]|nr:DUF4136 domain-containing protein [Bacteroides sp.]